MDELRRESRHERQNELEERRHVFEHRADLEGVVDDDRVVEIGRGLLQHCDVGVDVVERPDDVTDRSEHVESPRDGLQQTGHVAHVLRLLVLDALDLVDGEVELEDKNEVE